MNNSFPKIFALGTRHTKDIFDGKYEITEKLDGSQFGFGKDVNGNLFCRSKNKFLDLNAPEKMFSNGVNYVKSIENIIPDGCTYYCEYLQKPKHNVLKYDHIPKNHLALFGVYDHTRDIFVHRYESMYQIAFILGIDIVPRFTLNIKTKDDLKALLDTLSFLGGAQIEGFVVKKYVDLVIGHQVYPVTCAKYVSEKFKEVHRTQTKQTFGNGPWEAFKDSYQTEARWQKAWQHLNDDGVLNHEPRDIPALMTEVNRDIAVEEKEIIKDFLWKKFGKELLRHATKGLPEWYKNKLSINVFEKEKQS